MLQIIKIKIIVITYIMYKYIKSFCVMSTNRYELQNF